MKQTAKKGIQGKGMQHTQLAQKEATNALVEKT